MNSEPSLKWVRFDLFHENHYCMMGYVCVLTCFYFSASLLRTKHHENEKHMPCFNSCGAISRLVSTTRVLLRKRKRFWSIFSNVAHRPEYDSIGAFKRISQTFQEATSLLLHIYQCNKREFEFSIRSLTNKSVPKANVTPVVSNRAQSTLPDVTPPPPPTPLPEVTVLPDLNNRTEAKFSGGKKLILIIDLDMTLVHAIHEEESIGLFLNWLHGASESNEEDEWKKTLKDQIHTVELFYVDDNGSARMSNLLIKIRPGVREMLQTLSNSYEMIVYTQGENQYAEKVMQIIDPDKYPSFHSI